MAKETYKTVDKILKYRQEFERWFNVLKDVHTGRFNDNYEQYNVYTKAKGTKTKISDPVAPEITERQIVKMFGKEPKFSAMAKGLLIPDEIKNIISAVPAYYWSCPERVKSSGTMRSKLKVGAREYCITGNLVGESYYNPESDTPDWRVRPVEDYIFDPAMTIKTSPVRFAIDFVNLKYIEDNIEITKDGKLVKGMFSPEGVKRLKELFKDSNNQGNPNKNKINRNGDNATKDQVGPIALISRWERSTGKCCRFVNGKEDDQAIFVQEFDSVFGEDPFDAAMDIELVKQPYGYSALDLINGLTGLKDLTLNQLSDYSSKVLNPPTYADPNIGPIGIASLKNAYMPGGIVMAAPGMTEQKPIAPIGSFAFDMLGYIQQRSESVTGISSSLGGMLNPESDRLNKTASGINQMLEQAVGPVQARQQDIEESIIEPMANKWLKMAGFLMGKDEVKYILMTGENEKWVRVTKGLLTGKITLGDLLEAELIDEMGVQEIASSMLAEGKDPATELVFDVDWIIRVEIGSMAEANVEAEITKIERWAAFNKENMVPQNAVEMSKEMGRRIGIKDPDKYIITPPANPGMGQDMGGGMPPEMGGMPPQGMPMGMPPEMPQAQQPM